MELLIERSRKHRQPASANDKDKVPSQQVGEVPSKLAEQSVKAKAPARNYSFGVCSLCEWSFTDFRVKEFYKILQAFV